MKLGLPPFWFWSPFVFGFIAFVLIVHPWLEMVMGR